MCLWHVLIFLSNSNCQFKNGLSEVNSFCSTVSAKRTKVYLHKQCKPLPIQVTLNVTNVTGWGENNWLYGQLCSHGSIWDVFTRTAGIQHCSQETTSIHTCLKEPVHRTKAVWWNRGYCPVLISLRNSSTGVLSVAEQQQNTKAFM